MKLYVTACLCLHQGLDVKSDLYNTHGLMYFTAQELVKGRSVGTVKRSPSHKWISWTLLNLDVTVRDVKKSPY